MSFANNWGHLKHNMSRLRQKIDQKQSTAKSILSSPKLNLAARKRKRMSLVTKRNKEMMSVRLISLILLVLSIGLLYYLIH